MFGSACISAITIYRVSYTLIFLCRPPHYKHCLPHNIFPFLELHIPFHPILDFWEFTLTQSHNGGFVEILHRYRSKFGYISFSHKCCPLSVILLLIDWLLTIAFHSHQKLIKRQLFLSWKSKHYLFQHRLSLKHNLLTLVTLVIWQG